MRKAYRHSDPAPAWGGGATLPGYVARLIDPQILSTLSSMVREKIIVTMGTNGKTATNNLLYQSLIAEGKKVLINQAGANMLNGVISAFVLAADKKGHLSADYACIEVDEIDAVHILTELKPGCVILTDISRDQLDRFGSVDLVCKKMQRALSCVPKARLVVLLPMQDYTPWARRETISGKLWSSPSLLKGPLVCEDLLEWALRQSYSIHGA